LYGLSLIVTVGAMFSKEFCFTIPLAMILYEFLFINGPEYRRANRWALMIPFLCTLPIIPLLLLKPVAAMTPTARIAKTASTHEEQAPSFLSRLDRISRTETEISRKDYFLTQINVLRTYVRLLFWPSKQNIDYDYPITKKFLGIPTVLSAVLLASLLIFAFAIRKRWPLITFGILWFFLTLSVESTVIPIGYVINEHRLYLPMAGWAVAISSILTGLFKSRNALWAVFLLILLSLSFATLRRNTVWKDEITLWEDTSSKSPQKARPVTNLGIAYKDAQQYDKAIMTLLRAIDLDPNNAVAYTAMAFCHRYRGDPPEKEEELLKKAIALNPYYSLAHFGLGYYYHSKGFPDKAIPHYENALLLDPQSESIYKNLAVAYAQNNKLQKINVLIRMLDDQGMEFMAARLRSFFEPKTKKPY
ncbi:MAG TPA: tetratricopeptide repeat protein, partial [Candidatus Omnitrophota bacterium]|nr:tetratricopeptide repeat protein [Candidatus Omnitrophota bacterium]